MSEGDHHESAVSMLDVLEEEKMLEADANAVLGDSDDKNCTYIMGYAPRQALYSCLSCTPAPNEAGVCLACSLECHDGHELVELYTKRAFRCDCGNSKFGESDCKLFKDKAKVNGFNSYNQNFHGVYCKCSRPYPDPDEEVEDEMIQCIICEDWHHGRHLDSVLPEDKDYEEMICSGCMDRLDFLWSYTHICTGTKFNHKECVVSKGCEDKDLNVDETISKCAADNSTLSGQDASHSGTDGSNPSSSQTEDTEGEAATSTSKGNTTENASTCILRLTKEKFPPVKGRGAVFWPEGWRTKLCTCSACQLLYTEKDVTFLADLDDTITAYEKRGLARVEGASQYEQGMQALSKMDRVQQVEVLHGFNDMRSELTEYLKKFADNKKVVKEEDIKEFFSQMSERKRQKTDMGYFCK